jgi:hypothetical protein
MIFVSHTLFPTIEMRQNSSLTRVRWRPALNVPKASAYGALENAALASGGERLQLWQGSSRLTQRVRTNE